MDEQYITESLDHFGLIAGVCDKISLVEKVDSLIGETDREVSPGEALKAMILNALGFVGRPLYLSPEFMATKPVTKLFGNHLCAENFNESSLGRALDLFYKNGVTELFAHIANHALNIFEIDTKAFHLDSTTMSFQGEYESNSQDSEVVKITYGFSKDSRPDLKQVVVSLICCHKSNIPNYLTIGSGNESDKKSFVQTIEAFSKQLKESEFPYFVADSALYTAENLTKLDTTKWITRVPASIKAVKLLSKSIKSEYMKNCDDDSYQYFEIGSFYGNCKQRWFLFFSKNAYKSEVKTLEKKIEKEYKATHKLLNSLEKKVFTDDSEAIDQLNILNSKQEYHIAKYKLVEVKKYNSKGRPKNGEKKLSINYKLNCTLERNEEAIEKIKASKGRFILATNELDEEKLCVNKVLNTYKSQGSSVERGFRFLKDPMFFAHSLFLKKPERIMAMIMVMTLSLLVYSLAEHWLRKSLKEKNKTLPDQKGKETQSITMRRIFQIFEGIDVLTIRDGEVKKIVVTNLKDLHKEILELLGPEVEKYYF